MVTLGDPYAESPTVGEQWRAMDDATRKMLCHRTLFGMPVTVLEARPNGHVIVRLDDDLDAAARGILLREVEKRLKANIDEGILVYLEPMQDRNALRRLRGVKVQ